MKLDHRLKGFDSLLGGAAKIQNSSISKVNMSSAQGLKTGHDQRKGKRSSLGLDKVCKKNCRKIKRQTRDNLSRAQRRRGGRKSRIRKQKGFLKKCKNTCKRDAKEKIKRGLSEIKEKINSELKKCPQNPRVSRQTPQGFKQKLKKKRRRKREKDKKCRSKRKGRLLGGIAWTSSALALPSIAIGTLPTAALGVRVLPNLGIGLGTTGFSPIKSSWSNWSNCSISAQKIICAQVFQVGPPGLVPAGACLLGQLAEAWELLWEEAWEQQ